MEDKRKRKVISFTIDSDILEKFNKITTKAHQNKSRVVEGLIKKFINE